MKKLLSVLLAVLTLMLLTLQVSAQGEGFETLPELQIEQTPLRSRKQVDGLRMYVDSENPLFMIRNCPIWGGPQTGEAFAEYAIKTFNALPEDIRNFAVIYIDEGTTDMTPARQLEFWDELLTVTDAAGGKLDNPNDFRQTVISLSGFENEPAVTANGATMKTEWNAENKKLTLTVISNGMVTMNIKE